MKLELQLADYEYARWAADAVFSGLPLAEWIRRRVGSVEVVRRDRAALEALRARRDAAVEVRADGDAEPDGIPDDGEEVGDARVPKVVANGATRPRIRDLAGQRFGLLTVVELTASRDKSGNCGWLCRCACGNSKVVVSTSLVSGMTKSCGCMRRGPRRFRSEV